MLYRGNMVLRTEIKSYDTSLQGLESKGMMMFIHSATQTPTNLIPFQGLDIEDSGFAQSVVYETNTKVMEFEIPYDSMYAAEAINLNPSTLSQYYENKTNAFSALDETSMSYTAVMSLRIADETTFGVWMGLPLVDIAKGGKW